MQFIPSRRQRAGHMPVKNYSSPFFLSSSLACSTLSSACWPLDHSTSSLIPSSKLMDGLYPSLREILEMSDMKCLMSPFLNLLLTVGLTLLLYTFASVSATPSIVVGCCVPTLKTP